MCEPTTIALVATVASAAVGAYSSIQQGRATYQAEMMNAEIQRQNAQSVEDEQANVKDEAAIARRRLGERVRAERGDAVAKYTAMGLDPGFGSPKDVVGDIEKSYDIDRSILGKNEITQLERLDKQKADYLDAAKLGTMSAKSALKAGNLAAVGSLLDGASSVAGRWIMPGGGASTGPFRPAQAPIPARLPAPRPMTLLQVGG